jgi:hypothetical protein
MVWLIPLNARRERGFRSPQTPDPPRPPIKSASPSSRYVRSARKHRRQTSSLASRSCLSFRARAATPADAIAQQQCRLVRDPCDFCLSWHLLASSHIGLTSSLLTLVFSSFPLPLGFSPRCAQICLVSTHCRAHRIPCSRAGCFRRTHRPRRRALC